MRKKKPLPALARAFSVIAAEGGTLESKADSVLAIVKDAGLKDLKTFNAAAREAYRANGWNARAGKPARGNRSLPVPSTVKQYVSHVRAAFRYGVNVAQMASFFKLRQAVKAARLARKPRLVVVDPKMAGVRLAQTNELTGAPFHDLAVIYGKLPKHRQAALARDAKALAGRYESAVAPLLELVKKAA